VYTGRDSLISSIGAVVGSPRFEPGIFASNIIVLSILFAAYTGQRPDATIGKLTFEDFEDALMRNPPMLWVPAEKDKESFPHWVPLHPVVVEWTKPIIELKHMGQSKRIFPYDLIRKALDELDIKAVHTQAERSPAPTLGSSSSRCAITF